VEDKDRLQIAWQAFSMENSLLQSYRVLFMMVEAALLALGFMLLELYEGAWIWAPASSGFIVAVLWGIICHYKGKDVDEWRDRIINLKSAVGNDWFEYLKPGVKFPGGRIARWIFNYIIPGLVFLLWIFITVRAVLC
jgi:hypothetical protein